jgi:PAS domain S-box-containing protein/putative nucleotidyltransferase with HDIG domain
LTARYKHKDRTWHTLEATVRNLVHDPKVGGLLINYRDITERVKAEDERRRLREYLQLQIGRMPTGLITWDREFRVQSWNPAAGEIFGFTAEEVLGKHPYDCIVPREAQPHVDDIWRRLLEGDMTAYSINENTAKDGRTILCQWTNTPLKEADGTVIGVLSMVQDITERRKAEEALRSSEERFRTIFEKSPIGAIVYDSTGVAVGANKACLDIFGLSDVADMKGPALFEDPKSSEQARRRLRAGKTVSAEVQIDLDEARRTGLYNTTRSGMACLSLTATPLGTTRDGAASGYLMLVEDVTERKKAEEDLRASEERFRTIFERSPIGAIVFDSAGVALSANKACMDIFGLSGEADLKGPPLLSDPLLTDGARRRLSAGKSITAESQINLDEAKRIYSYRYGRSGAIFMHLTITPLGTNVKGVPSGYLALVEDITERKKAEEALRASEERFRGLVETTSDWVWEVDAKGVYTYASPRVTKVLGYDTKELVGKTPFDFMPQKEARRAAAVFNGFVAKREPFAFLESVNRHKNGRPVVMETSGVPFFASDGTLLGYRGVDRDITERKQVGRQLQQSLRRLERTMEAIIQAISATIETRDPYTAGHQRRVTQLACVIAKDMNLPAAQIAGIRVAGLLHDIGKICVPTEILNKPGQLSDVEMALIRAHPKVGYGILKSIEFEWPVADIVVQHHERLDGSGYPSGMRGDDILLEARILAVADVVEAMSSHRPYRPAVGMEKALAEITRGQGTLYDSVGVQVCLEIFKKKGFQFEAF